MLYVIFNMTGLTISSNSLLFFLLSEHQSFLEMRSVLDHYELERFFPMVVVSILPHAEFGRIDHLEDAPHFIVCEFYRFVKGSFIYSSLIFIKVLSPDYTRD